MILTQNLYNLMNALPPLSELIMHTFTIDSLPSLRMNFQETTDTTCMHSNNLSMTPYYQAYCSAGTPATLQRHLQHSPMYTSNLGNHHRQSPEAQVSITSD